MATATQHQPTFGLPEDHHSHPWGLLALAALLGAVIGFGTSSAAWSVMSSMTDLRLSATSATHMSGAEDADAQNELKETRRVLGLNEQALTSLAADARWGDPAQRSALTMAMQHTLSVITDRTERADALERQLAMIDR